MKPPFSNASGMRRHFLRLGAAALVAGLLPLRLPSQLATQDSPSLSSTLLNAAQAGTGLRWQNWSGIVSCTPSAILTPSDEAEITKLMQSKPSSVRCVGSGHSFTPLVSTDTQMISLDRLAGVISHTADTVSVRGGTRLAQLSRQLDERQLALRNLPDIDMQTIAGAIATATHGTGLELPALHADVIGMRLITAQGEVLQCDETAPQLLAAAKVSLGCLGVVTQVNMRVLPRYNLQRRVWLRPLNELLNVAPELARKHRHFEFYYLPFTGYAAAITHDLYAGQDVAMPASADEDMLRDLRRLRDWAGRFPDLRRWLASKLIDDTLEEKAKNRSFKLLSTARPTKFNESECHVPRAHGIACVREVIAKLEQRNEVFFPLEFRFVKADDAWLSPFYLRDSCSIAVHAAEGEPYDYLVSEIGPIFRKYQGRPHWGKLHQFSSRELAQLYPRWQDFLQLRSKLDPDGRLLNPHLKQLFGI